MKFTFVVSLLFGFLVSRALQVEELLEEAAMEKSSLNPPNSLADQIFYSINCSRPLRGQYSCRAPVIDAKTQQPANCTKENRAPVNCTLNDGLICLPGTEGPFFNNSFIAFVACEWTTGYHFETTLLLSIFLGMFGADRFYLGYPGLGLLKFCTLGFFFFGQLVDIVLIAMQLVKPADGSNYVIKHFGPKLVILSKDNFSYIVPRNDW